jgi:curved DNA-binding protein CbpA
VDYYAVLGVHPSAEDIVIRAAYKALAQRYHPDRFVGSKDEAHRRMSEISIAYEVLADPLLRPQYDRRRFNYTRSIAARFNNSAGYASPPLDPGDPRSARPMRRRFRVALAALVSVAVALSVFNLFHYSAQIKEWVGTSTARPPSSPIVQGVTTAVETAIPNAHPLPPADPSVAPAAMSLVPKPSGIETTRAGTKNAAINGPAKSAPAPVEVAKAKPTTPSARTCSQQEQILGFCK